MIVARQFIAWNTPKKGEPSRRDGVSRATRHIRRLVRKTSCRPNHIVPYETGSLRDTLQAINCLATIIPSLRDNDSQDPQIRRQISDAQPRIVQTSQIVLIAVRHSALDLGLASEARPVEDQQKRMSRSSSLPAGYFFAYIRVQFAV
jgi:hypothetical protein